MIKGYIISINIKTSYNQSQGSLKVHYIVIIYLSVKKWVT